MDQPGETEYLATFRLNRNEYFVVLLSLAGAVSSAMLTDAEKIEAKTLAARLIQHVEPERATYRYELSTPAKAAKAGNGA